MKLAVPVFHGRVSPVLDSAGLLLLVEYSGGHVTARSEKPLDLATPQQRIARICELNVDTVIAGAVSKQLQFALAAAGINLIPVRRGPIEKILTAFVAGSLADPRFCLPGCSASTGDRSKTAPKSSELQGTTGATTRPRADRYASPATHLDDGTSQNKW
jgi:predicted Fe-Mo cluster-binding NifX family protein